MLTVLLIHDNEDEFLLLSAALFKLEKSLNCVHANSPLSGLKMLTRFTPAYIFIGMGGNTGSGCIRSIRELEKHRTTPIVVYSTDVTENEWKEAKQNGADCCLEKAGSLDALVESLHVFFLEYNRLLFFRMQY